eukprot:scaffold32968_cov84-Isochrysis_galbana.AAC.1
MVKLAQKGVGDCDRGGGRAGRGSDKAGRALAGRGEELVLGGRAPAAVSVFGSCRPPPPAGWRSSPRGPGASPPPPPAHAQSPDKGKGGKGGVSALSIS